MRREIFTLPSGAQLEFRGTTVAEEDAMTAQKKREFQHVNDLLSACCLGVVDPGPYPNLQAGDKPDWDKMLGGDRGAAFIYLRTISFRDGKDYDFDWSCPACKKRREYRVDLLSEFPVQPLSEESAEAFREGRGFEIVVDGKKVTYRHAIGSDAERFELLSEQHEDQASSVSLYCRIKSVEGLKQGEILPWLQGLSSDDAEDLRDAVDEMDCGFDLDTEMNCRCGFNTMIQLPFVIAFFLPGRKRNKRKKSRRLKHLASAHSERMES